MFSNIRKTNSVYHLHILTQEALDHADLTVLTGTIGATSLLKNCLWFYIQSIQDSKQTQTTLLQNSFKKYQEMEEALAERLLDLHCRLLSLYILQDADCLDWKNPNPFFESERGSYIIQMWWLYMKGTKENLWNSVPPKMAQRVFMGMLNESLTILTVRYTQASPSMHRTTLLIVDLSNLLLCIAQLLPCVCDNAEDYMGISLNKRSKILRDIHSKCQELLYCLMLRGAPLDILNRVFRRGVEKIELFKCKNSGPSPWILFSLPNIFIQFPRNILKLEDFPSNIAISLELMVLLSQSQPSWSLLLKVLGLKSCKLLNMIIQLCLNKCKDEIKCSGGSKNNCLGFLCSGNGQCGDVDQTVAIFNSLHYFDLFRAATDVLLTVSNTEELLKILLEPISRKCDWGKCLDRRNVWNQKKPGWYIAVMDLTKPILSKIIDTAINAVKTGASMYQAMSIILVCFSYFWDCLDPNVLRFTNMIQDILPSDIIPLHHSVLLQTLVSALYSSLLVKSMEKKRITLVSEKNNGDGDKEPISSVSTTFDGINSSNSEIALALAEGLCSIDEDNKHTDQIEEFLNQTKNCIEITDFEMTGSARLEGNVQMCENIVSDLLITERGKQNMKILFHFVKNNYDWIFQQLGIGSESAEFTPNKVIRNSETLLFTMFHIGARPFDQVLTGEWQPQWINLLETPMGLTTDKVSTHINQRWEFSDINSSSLTTQDKQAINNISTVLKSVT
ncbi:hypothetical protein WA026_012898 [Henosepilachna vigintioctopunctata]|uniref:Uncharacterized protein n=1 Tax=Henosepilachna vigintioctopunctata TaxID=420089 RepID=A0AAW1TK38_9CUCU